MPSFPPPLPAETYAWRSTHVVSATDETELTCIRDSCEQSMVEVDAEITSLHTRLQQLEEERKSQASRIARLNSALAPIRKLHPELLSLIFEYVHGDSAIHINRSQFSEDRGPLRATQPELVCRVWRDITMHTPYVFNRVTVYLGPYTFGRPETVDSLVEFAHQIMSRGTRFITVSVDVDADPSSTELEAAQRLATEKFMERLLLPYNSQLEVLEVFNSNTVQEMVDSLIKLICQLPSLKRFEETLTDRNNNHFDDTESRLTFVLPPSATDGEVPGPWNNLTSLSLGSEDDDVYLSLGMAHNLLSECRNLRHCVLCVSTIEESDPSMVITGATLQLDHLASFRLFIGIRDERWTTAVFLQPLLFPALKSLVFRCWGSAVHPEDIVALINRSSCQLKSFALYDAEADITGDLRPLLNHIPFAKNVAVPNSILDPPLLEEIGSGTLLPNAQDLTLRFRNDSESRSALVDLVESRWGKGNGDLKKVRALCHPDASLSTTILEPIVEACRGAGRVLTLENSSQIVIATEWQD